ncbi:MAG: hypothetical protein DI601_21280 [Azospirillum brasilense]|nr:MAG: hypothetical protein DI601_21280 [Azospirillum brasilense]
MITITGLQDHLRLDQPIRITGIRTVRAILDLKGGRIAECGDGVAIPAIPRDRLRRLVADGHSRRPRIASLTRGPRTF